LGVLVKSNSNNRGVVVGKWLFGVYSRGREHPGDREMRWEDIDNERKVYDERKICGKRCKRKYIEIS